MLRQGGLDYQPKPDGLHEAAKRGLDHEVIAMLKKGFSVDLQDKDGNTPLFYAIENDRFQTAVILLEYKANVNHKSKHGFTPLMYAAWKGHVDLVSLLIKHGAGPSFSTFKSCLTLLATAWMTAWAMEEWPMISRARSPSRPARPRRSGRLPTS